MQMDRLTDWLLLVIVIHLQVQNSCAFCFPDDHYFMSCDSTLPSYSPVIPRIVGLYLAQCSITALVSDAFANYASLQELRVECQYDYQQYPDHPSLTIEKGLFSPVNATLHKLQLNHNNIRNLPEKLFCGLPVMASIDLDHNLLTDVTGIGFGSGDCSDLGWDSLRELRLGNNHFTKVHCSAFSRLGRLETLALSHNRLRDIDRSAFAGMVNLRTLHLRKNDLAFLHHATFEGLPLLTELALGHNRLTTPQLPSFGPTPQLRILNLSNNNLTAIGGATFANLTHLTELDLSLNQLRSIDSEFKTLVSLWKLKLNSNGIEQIAPKAFTESRHLGELFVRYNRLRAFDGRTLVTCNISTLDLTGNQLTTVPDMRNLSGIERLLLGNNRIPSLAPLPAVVVPTVTRLNLSSNEIKVIEASTFARLTHLEELDLSSNNILTIANGSFNGNQKLKRVYLDCNQLSNLSSLFKKTNVELISASHNHIRRFSYADIPYATRSLNLSGNELTDDSIDGPKPAKLDQDRMIFYNDDLSVTDVDFSHNRLQTFNGSHFPPSVINIATDNNIVSKVDPPFSFEHLQSLKTLTLHNNRLQGFCERHNDYARSPITATLQGNPLRCNCELSWFVAPPPKNSFTFRDLAWTLCDVDVPPMGNQTRLITQLSPDQFLCVSTQDRPSSCECGGTTRTSAGPVQCQLPCPDRCECRHDGQITFLAVGCTSTNQTAVPIAPPSLTGDVTALYLYLDGNAIDVISDTSLHGYANLTALYLNCSSLRSIHVNAFRSTSALQLLHLEDNRLRSIPKDLFLNQGELREVHLSGNGILQLDGATFEPLVKLEVLRLDRNHLYAFPVWALSNLTCTLRVVTLAENPWKCSCEYVERFRDWLQTYASTVPDIDGVYCASGLDDMVNRTVASFNSTECQTLVNTIITMAPIWGNVLSAFVFLTVASVLLFLYRGEIQVLIYTKYGVRLFHRRNVDALDADKLFDAFLAYSSQDEQFLVEQLIPGLEKISNPYRLCLHQRNFEIGEFINENIQKAVASSCRTIVLLSDHFIKSEWCLFEFKTAHAQMLEDQCNRIIVIILDQVPANVDRLIRLYLRTNTYLKWGDRLFWEKLYYALPDRKWNTNRAGSAAPLLVVNQATGNYPHPTPLN